MSWQTYVLHNRNLDWNWDVLGRILRHALIWNTIYFLYSYQFYWILGTLLIFLKNNAHWVDFGQRKCIKTGNQIIQSTCVVLLETLTLRRWLHVLFKILLIFDFGRPYSLKYYYFALTSQIRCTGSIPGNQNVAKCSLIDPIYLYTLLSILSIFNQHFIVFCQFYELGPL